MLSYRHRLCLRTELTRIKKNGQLFPGQFFGLLAELTFSQDSPRFAFIISKKVAHKAVQRNQAKRLLSESVRSFLPLIKPGIRGVFLAKKGLIGQNLAIIKKETAEIFRKANLFNEKTAA